MKFSAPGQVLRLRSGQAILVVLLVMVVGLTMGLSLATRSVTDLKISGQSEDSAKAFSAAESGIEIAVKGEITLGNCSGNVNIGTGTYNVCVSSAGGSDSAYLPGNVNIADTFTVWLVGHNSSGDLDLTVTPYTGNSLDVCWQKADKGGTIEPALEITVLYQDGSAYKVWRGAYDSDSTRATVKNNFNYSSVVQAACADTVQNKVTVSLSSLGTKRIALRLRPFYASASLAVVPLSTYALPTQGLTINSIGTSAQTTRKVSVTQSYNSLSSIFDYVLFSGKDILK